MVFDRSGVVPALDLSLSGDGFEWAPTGLRFFGNASTIALASESPTKLEGACVASNEITLEAWVTPAQEQALGPDRIVTYSVASSTRNFSLAQGQSPSAPAPGWQARLRTTETSLNGLPALEATDPIVVGVRTHILYAREAGGGETSFTAGVGEG